MKMISASELKKRLKKKLRLTKRKELKGLILFRKSSEKGIVYKILKRLLEEGQKRSRDSFVKREVDFFNLKFLVRVK